jgi:hypothetical protein
LLSVKLASKIKNVLIIVAQPLHLEVAPGFNPTTKHGKIKKKRIKVNAIDEGIVLLNLYALEPEPGLGQEPHHFS